MLDRARIEAELPPCRPRPAGAPKALEGIRVVDFTHFLAGPVATMMMADMGADVIKVEMPGRGDEFRHYPPVPAGMEAQGAPYLWANRNKRSIALNLKRPEALAIVRELVATADVVAENFSTGVMGRFGLDYEGCRRINPKIVYCSVSAYGRDGEFADRLGFDLIAQAESGFVSMNGYPDRQGVRARSPVMDISTAMLACSGVLGALLARARTGEGQVVEATLFDSAVLMTGYAAMQCLLTGTDPERLGNASNDTCPTDVFQSRDRPFFINVGTDKIFRRLVLQVLERPDLLEDPVLADRNGRLQRREELTAVLGEAFAEHPWSYWQPRMRAALIPCGEVRSLGDALHSPEARARNLVNRIPHPEVGWLPNISLPLRFSGTPIVDPVPAPALGQHTEEVLREMPGFDDARWEALVRSGALGTGEPA